MADDWKTERITFGSPAHFALIESAWAEKLNEIARLRGELSKRDAEIENLRKIISDQNMLCNSRLDEIERLKAALRMFGGSV